MSRNLALSLCLIGAMVSTPAAATESRPRFTAADMLDILGLARGQPVALSSDGSYAAYVLSDVRDEWNVLARRPRGYLFVHRLDGEEPPMALSAGATRSSFPVFSPDGARLAFYLEDADGARLSIWERASGTTRVVGEAFEGRPYLAPQWDEAGRRLLYPRAAASEPEAPAPRVRVLRSTDSRLPGDAFFLNRNRARLAVIDLDRTPRERVLHGRPVPLRSFELSSTGSHVLYRAPTPESEGLVGREETETWLVALDPETASPPLSVARGEATRFTPAGDALLFREEDRLEAKPLNGGPGRTLVEGLKKGTVPFFSPDGGRLVGMVADPSLSDPEVEAPQPGMYSIARPFYDLELVSIDDGRTEKVTAGFTDDVGEPVWSADGASFYFRAVDNETYDETLYRYRLEEQRLERLVGGRESYGELWAGGDRLLFSAETATHPAELFVIEAGGERRRLTDLNPQLERFAFATPELFHFESTDGDRLGALLYRPPGLAAGEKVPFITYVYEKLTPGIHRFQARHQIFLSHGYGVVMPNVKVKVGETASSFVRSVVPAVEAVARREISNGKFCMWGGSFGAFATSYVITQTDIFECAVSRATPPELFRNWASGRDRDSVNIERGQARMGGSPFEQMERYLSQSAFFHLDQVQTPVLLLHGVEDRTILVGEGEMMFYALRRLGKDATLVLYREGDHSLSRHSREDTLDVYRRMLDWLAKYLRQDGGVTQ